MDGNICIHDQGASLSSPFSKACLASFENIWMATRRYGIVYLFYCYPDFNLDTLSRYCTSNVSSFSPSFPWFSWVSCPLHSRHFVQLPLAFLGLYCCCNGLATKTVGCCYCYFICMFLCIVHVFAGTHMKLYVYTLHVQAQRTTLADSSHSVYFLLETDSLTSLELQK